MNRFPCGNGGPGEERPKKQPQKSIPVKKRK